MNLWRKYNVVSDFRCWAWSNWHSEYFPQSSESIGRPFTSWDCPFNSFRMAVASSWPELSAATGTPRRNSVFSPDTTTAILLTCSPRYPATSGSSFPSKWSTSRPGNVCISSLIPRTSSFRFFCLYRWTVLFETGVSLRFPPNAVTAAAKDVVACLTDIFSRSQVADKFLSLIAVWKVGAGWDVPGDCSSSLWERFGGLYSQSVSAPASVSEDGSSDEGDWTVASNSVICLRLLDCRFFSWVFLFSFSEAAFSNLESLPPIEEDILSSLWEARNAWSSGRMGPDLQAISNISLYVT